VRFDDVAQAVAGIKWMSPAQGRLIYDHVIAERPETILELGTAWGVSAAYMAAALDELGRGRIVTIDRLASTRLPEEAAFAQLPQLLERVELIRTPHSSYAWFLKQRVEERSDADGNVSPLYDFCYLDGAHDFTIDGLAAVLVEKLLRPGGWLLIDDLDWAYATDGICIPAGLSEDERRTPPMTAVWELIVKQHPSFTQFRVQDGCWGWALKAPGESRRLSLETSSSLGALAVQALHRARRSRRTRANGSARRLR
jgi:predicted O-methyltransferase YrrM